MGKGNRTLWGRKPLSAYTWMRTNKGPQKQWLFHLGKSDTPQCPCGTIESGEHIVFSCPLHDTDRKALIGPAQSWEALDDPRFHEDDEDQETNLVEEFFSYIFAHFS